jgi:hypothetical protein
MVSEVVAGGFVPAEGSIRIVMTWLKSEAENSRI